MKAKIDPDHYYKHTPNGPVKTPRETEIKALTIRHKHMLDQQTARMDRESAKRIRQEADQEFYAWIERFTDPNKPTHIVPYSKHF
jgi:hypothetical protein